MLFCPRWPALFIMLAALSGCAGNDLMIKRQAEAESKIEHLIQLNKKSEQRLNEQAAQIQPLENRLKSAVEQIQQLQDSVQALRKSQEEGVARLVALTRQTATPRIEVINPEPQNKSKEAGPPAEYVKAFGYYSTNNIPSAIESFEQFLKVYPNSDYSANAYYWIGECHYTLSDLPRALGYFQKVVDGYPKSAKVPDALLKLGYTLSAMKEKEKAMAVFDRLIKVYPGSAAAIKARERLTLQQ